MLELVSMFNCVVPLPKPQLTPPSIVENITSIHVAPRKTVHFNIPGTNNQITPLYIDTESPRVDTSPPRVGITSPPYSAIPRAWRVDMKPPCVDTPHPLIPSPYSTLNNPPIIPIVDYEPSEFPTQPPPYFNWTFPRQGQSTNFRNITARSILAQHLIAPQMQHLFNATSQ